MTADEIRAARQRAGLSQGALAKLVGVSMRTVGNWERGESAPGLAEQKLVDVLRQHLDDDDAGEAPLRSVSDVELLAEIARRFARAEQRERGEHGGDTAATKLPATSGQPQDVDLAWTPALIEGFLSEPAQAEAQSQSWRWFGYVRDRIAQTPSPEGERLLEEIARFLEVSEPDGKVSRAVAAHEEEGSIAGEQEESDTP